MKNPDHEILQSMSGHHDITKDTLRQKGGRLWQLLMDTVMDGVAIVDHHHRIVDANQRFADMLGYSMNELLTLHTWDIDAKMSEQDIRSNFADSNITNQTFETQHRRKDGTIYDAEVSIEVTRYEDLTLNFAITRDISDRKQVESDLHQNKQALIEAQSIAKLGSWELSFQTNQLNWSEEMYRIFNKDPQRFTPSFELIMQHVHPEDRDLVDTRFSEAISEKQSYELIHRLLIEDQVKFIEAKGKFFYDQAGNPSHAIGTVQDITELKSAEAEIRQSEKKLSTILDNVDAYIYLKDLHGQYLFANRAVRELWHVEMDDIIGFGDETFFDAETAANIRRNDQRVLANGEVLHAEETNTVTETGKTATYQSVKLPLRDESGNIYALCGVSTDITDRKQAEAELQRHRNQLQELVEEQTALVQKQASIISQVHDSIVTTDLEGYITSWNQGAENLFGHSAQKMLGKHINVVYPDDEQEFLLNHVIAPLKEKGQHETEVRMLRADGSLFHAHLSLSMLHDHDGSAVGMVGYSIDITNQKTTENALKEAKEAAEAATIAKSAFLANMSHEIRTPMNAIIGMSHLALQTELNDKQKNYIQNIHRSGEGLLRILNDILDFSKIESGKLELEFAPFNVREACEQIMALLKIRAYEKDISMRLDISPDVPNDVSGDVLRLTQVLNNLVSNAIKFSEPGGEVTIQTSQAATSPDSVSLQFLVRDHGVGISQEEQRKLFSAFSQADSSTTRKFGGSGLGLTISKNITELMGGKIWVESEKGQGSTFGFTVPLGKVNEAEFSSHNEKTETEQEDGLTQAYSQLNGRKILLVEDNEINMELVMDLLLGHGMLVETAYDGQQAVDLVSQNNPFDLILMDCQMPVMDGYAATKQIRKRLDGHVPIIALTANVMKGDRDKAIEAGMNDHLGKPINPEQMFLTMAKWIQSKSTT